MTAKLYDEDTGEELPMENKGGYGLAIEAMAAMVGCDGPLVCMLRDAPLDDHVGDLPSGWANLADGEGEDRLYHDGKLRAVVVMSSRASWHAKAVTDDGRWWFSEGGHDDGFEPWQHIGEGTMDNPWGLRGV